MSAASTPGAGPSRTMAHLQPTPPAPSTSGDSESTVPHPMEKGLDLSLLKELMKSQLIEILNEIQGAKTLILDPSLAGPLGLITEVSHLKHQGVDKMFWLERGPLNLSTRNVVWLCRPKTSHMRTIAEQIRQAQNSPSGSGTPIYTILLVPRVTELCRRILEDEGVAGDVTLSQFKMEFMPLEEDVLSLELDDAAKDIFLNGDDTPLYDSSTALMTFQRAFGLFPRMMGKGDAAKRLISLLERHHTSGDPLYADLDISDQTDGLIVVDRSVDWVTPMCTQLTYEGMLDEFIGIKNGHIEIDSSLLDAQPPNQQNGTPPPVKKRKHHLDETKDRLFTELRDLNFAIVGSRLSKLARRLEGDYGGAKNLKSVSEMKQFVGKLGGLQSEQQSLKLHTGMMEQLMPITKSDEFNKTLEAQQNLVAGYDVSAQFAIIEDLMYQQIPWPTILRCAVLMSLTNAGIKPKILEAFKRDFLQIYGYHHLPLLIHLQTLGLLVKSPPTIPQPFNSLRKSLRLIVDDIDDGSPNDISYVYSGYAPLSIRLVQCITQKNAVLTGSVDSNGGVGADGERGKRGEKPKAHPIVGWRGFEDVLGSIPGTTVDVRQKSLSCAKAAGRPMVKEANMTTVVFFLGGCTFTEISALRWMAKQTSGRKFVIATTGIINGKSLLESLGDQPPKELRTR